ncbi:MAG: energy-coupling factor transporter transmembrane protein EcfT [Anaerolineales bacterium]|nr:energy-coupling factor transporter transmembrane protein EcfT [Anaerolineales bacterium]
MQIPFRYIDRNTLVHRMHPLLKILYMVLTLAVILTPLKEVKYVFVPLVWLVLSIILWAIARIEVSRFQALIKLLLGTFTFLILVQGFTYRWGSTVVLQLFNLKYGETNVGALKLEGMIFGAMLCLRILTATISLPLLVMTTSSNDLMNAFRQLRLPKVATFMIVSALSFTTLIFEMWEHITGAQKLRAFDIDRMNPVAKLRRAYVPIVTPLILLLFRKANDFQIALETRGFGTPGDPTVIEDRLFTVMDWIMLAIIVMVFAMTQYLRLRLNAM